MLAHLTTSRTSLAALAALLLASAGAGVWLAQRHGAPSATGAAATVLQPGKALVPFALRDHHGETFDLTRLEGRWSFLFFGFTHCPDACPTALATLARMLERLEPSAAGPPQVVFVSVDPARDTPDVLGQYVRYFHAAFLGVTGADAELERFTRRLGVVYARHDHGGTAEYVVDHSSSILLVDPAAELKAVFSVPHDAAAMARDFTALRQGAL